MTNNKKSMSIIIPIYDEEWNIFSLVSEIQKNLNQDFSDFSHEIILVNDGSNDKSRDEIMKLKEKSENIIAINLQRNYGQATALQVWFEYCSGDLVVTMDWDGQNDPKDIKKLYDKMQSEWLDVVAGWRKERNDKFSVRFITKCARLFRKLFIGDKIHDSGCTLRIYKKECITELHLWGEMHRYITEILSIKWYKVWEVQVNHRPRIHGQSKYNFTKTAKGFVDLLYIWFIAKYQSRPLHLFWWVWLVTFFVWTCSLLFSIYQKIIWWLSINKSGRFLVWVFMIQTGITIFILGIMIDILIRNYYNSDNEHRYIIKEIFK